MSRKSPGGKPPNARPKAGSRGSRPAVIVVLAVVTLLSASLVGAQPPRFPLPLEPEGSVGEAVWPAFEGWLRNEDGSLTLLLGYFNRNDEPLEIPIGENNRIEPGGPDRGQPTVFASGRGWGVFGINVPADFGSQKLTWTLVANRQTAEISFWLNPPYFVDPMLNRANGNTPPILTLGTDTLQVPPRGQGDLDVSLRLTTSIEAPLELVASITDSPLTIPPPERRGRRRRVPLTLAWSKYRGPGQVTFQSDQVEGSGDVTIRHEFEDLEGGETRTTVTFSEPGVYRLMATANDVSGDGGGGDQCCWTTGYVDVTVE